MKVLSRGRPAMVARVLLVVLSLLGAMVVTVSTSTPAAAAGTYSNASIADKALTYWNGSNTNRAPGSAACAAANKPGDTGGQCRAFVNCIVWMVSGGTQNLGGTDYFSPFLNAGGVEVATTDALIKGDIVQNGQGTHTFIIVSKVSAGEYMVVDSNHWSDETVGYYQRTVKIDGATVRAFRMGSSTAPTGNPSYSPVGSTTTRTMALLDGSGSIYAKTTLGNGGWGQQTSANSAKTVSAGGDTQVLLDLCDAVWAKSGLSNGGWSQETECGAARSVIVSSTGLQVILDFCGAIYAKKGIGYGGWGQQGACNSAKSVAVGSAGRQMIIGLDSSIWAKDTLGYGGWGQQTSPGSAVSISAG